MKKQSTKLQTQACEEISIMLPTSRLTAFKLIRILRVLFWKLEAPKMI